MSDDDSVTALLTLALKRIQHNDTAGSDLSLSSQELQALFSSFLPSRTPRVTSLGYVVTSAIVSNVRKQITDEAKATEDIARRVAPPLQSRLAGVDLEDLLSSISLLSALFQIDRLAASAVFLRDGLLESVMEAPDMFADSLPLEKAVANLLSQASGQSTCRSAVSSKATEWLEFRMRQTKDSTLQALAAIALTKLSKGSGDVDANGQPVEETPEVKSTRRREEESLAALMKRLVIDSPDSSPVLEAVEGLAYMTLEPNIKDLLCDDDAFLSRLFALLSGRQSSELPTNNSAFLYGCAVVISNLSAYPPQMSEEEKQVERLRQMTRPGASADDLKKDIAAQRQEGEASARKRGAKLVQAGVLSVLHRLAKADSQGIRQVAGQALLNLTENKENRGKILQSGGGKSLMAIIKQSLQSIQPSKSHSDAALLTSPVDLMSIQALAKLAITTSPLLLFGPNESASVDAIRPFTLLLLHEASTLLQKFEAMMALTNLASVGPGMATRIAGSKELMNKIEVLLLHENTMVQRAATELLCNLMTCDAIFERYSGEGASGGGASRLNILLALSDVDDVATRVAASGALAMLTSSQSASRALLGLEKGPSRLFSVLTDLISPSADDDDNGDDDGNDATHSATAAPTAPAPDPRLIHRGVVCVQNILQNAEPASSTSLVAHATDTGLVSALVGVVRDTACPNDVRIAAGESLRWLLAHGASIPV